MRWLRFGIAWILIGVPVLAAPKPWTLDAIMDLKSVSDPEITADGSRVAYVVSARDVGRNAYSSEIWIVPAAGDVGQRLHHRGGRQHPGLAAGDSGAQAMAQDRGGQGGCRLSKSLLQAKRSTPGSGAFLLRRAGLSGRRPLHTQPYQIAARE